MSDQSYQSIFFNPLRKYVWLYPFTLGRGILALCNFTAMSRIWQLVLKRHYYKVWITFKVIRDVSFLQYQIILDFFPATQNRKQKVSSYVLLALQILCLNLTVSLWQYNWTTTKQRNKLHNINYILCTKRCTHSLYTLHSTLYTLHYKL